MKGVPIFMLAVLIVLMLTTASYITLYVVLSGSDIHNFLAFPDKVQALSSILALIFGTSAAVGGAFATIKVAHLGVDITERQSALDAIQFLENKFQTTTGHYANVLFSIDRVMQAGVAVDLSIPHIDKEHAIEEMKKARPGELLAEMAVLNDAVVGLTRDLRAMATDEFSMYSYRTSARRAGSQLSFIADSLVRSGLDESSTRIHATDIAGICAILDVSRRRILGNTLQSVIEARTFTNSSEIELFGKSYNNAAVRSFFVLGNLIFCRTDTLPDDRMFIASYGSAMIHDLVYSIPTGEIIKDNLKSRYPQVAFAVDRIRSEFDVHNIVSDFTKASLDGAKKIGGLYLMISKISVPIEGARHSARD